MFKQINPNPLQKSTGDCVIRAISILLNKSWDEVYVTLCVYGYMLKDWGQSNSVWERYLYDQGYKKGLIPNTCPSCYTIKDFCRDVSGNYGKFLLATGSHVVTVISDDIGASYYDSWDSGNEIPIYYYWKQQQLHMK